MTRVPILILLLVASACSSSGQQTPQPVASSGVTRPAGTSGTVVSLSELQRAQIQSAVRARLANETAAFRTIIAQRDIHGAVTVCGYFNIGAGDTPFIGMLNNEGFTVADIGGTNERTIAVQRACHARGIYT